MEVPKEDYVPYAKEFDSYDYGRSSLNETADETYTALNNGF